MSSFFFILFFPNEASLAHHCPEWFYIIAVVCPAVFPPCAALFLESQLLLLLIYIIFFYGKQTFEKKKTFSTLSGAFLGMFMSSCLKLQMPSNMHGTSENTLEKQGMKLSGLLPGLSAQNQH